MLAAHSEVDRHEVISLKSPIWGNNNSRRGVEIPASGSPHRSKRSQQHLTKRLQKSHLTNLASEGNDMIDDDVSPTSSAGPATPQLTTSLNTRNFVTRNPSPTSDVSASGVLPQAWEAAVLEACQDQSHLNNVFGKKLLAKKPPTIPGTECEERPNKSDEEHADGSSQARMASTSRLRLDTPRSLRTLQGTDIRQPDRDHNKDHEDTVACLAFPSPFRRNSSTVTSSVRDRISIFEGLGKSSRCLSPTRNGEDREPSKSHNSILENAKTENKKRSFAWIPKKLRKTSVQQSKDRSLCHALTDEGTRPTSKTTIECQAKLGKFKDKEYRATHTSRDKKEPDTISFAPSLSEPQSRP